MSPALTPRIITPDELLQQERTILLDAYGVLLTGRGPLPGAREFISKLQDQDRNFLVVTNGCSMSAAMTARRYQTFGFEIPPERVLTSGSLLIDYFTEHQLENADILVLGGSGCHDLVRTAGGRVLPFGTRTLPDVVVVANQSDFPFLEGMDWALNALLEALSKDRKIHLLAPNPDLIYPIDDERFSFTAGSMASMLETAVALRFPDAACKFLRLGKPFRPIFEKASQILGSKSLIMLGDQLTTDIQGASDFGIPSVLIGTGVDSIRQDFQRRSVVPDFILEHL